jgi:RHS repeat-associated protein
MLVPNRNYSSPSYRYGFQGQEKDDEIKGSGNSLNFKFRMHDPRVGRFFAVDPLTKKYPFYTPYSFSGNKVIAYKELEGGEDLIAIKPPSTESNFFLTMSGDKIKKLVVKNVLRKFGETLEVESYNIAYKTLAKGKLKGSNGKIYTTSRITTQNVTLIDGTIVNDVKVGRNFGNKYFTTKIVNQVEAFKHSQMYNTSIVLAKHTGHFLTAYSIAKKTVESDGQIPADSLLGTSITGFVTVFGGAGAGFGAGILFTILNEEAKKIADIPYDAERSMIINSNKSADIVQTYLTTGATFKHDISIIRMQTSVMVSFLNGKIKTFDALIDAIESDENSEIERSSAIMLEGISDDTILVHKVYIDDKNSTTVDDKNK